MLGRIYVSDIDGKDRVVQLDFDQSTEEMVKRIGTTLGKDMDTVVYILYLGHY